MIFKKVDVRKPMNEPKAAFSASLESVLFKYSPINAPRKGPIMIPKGTGEITPIMKPIEVPMMPYLLPPKCLVPIAGKI